VVDQDLLEDYPLTAREFLHLPMASGKRYELLQGELLVPASPETRNMRIAGDLLFNIQTQLDAEPFGEVFIALTAVVLSKYDVVEPDLFLSSRTISKLK
jgi:Uma2 family endonuclease